MYQRLVLVGNLGRDPETRYSENGIPVTNFSVATTNKWSDASGEPHEETVWFRVATFGKQAETCQEYLTKGQRVLVEGTLIADPANGGPRIFTRKDGTPGAAFELRANTVRFLSPKSERANGGAHIADEAPDLDQEPLFP
jgi:single-strand DNA-binding protein